MRRLLILICIPFLLYSHPTRWGVRGFNNLISPLNDGTGYLNIITDGYMSMGGTKGHNFWGTVDLGLGVGFAATDWLSMNLFSRYMADAVDSVKNYLSHGMGDIEIGIKFTPSLLLKELRDGLNFGVYPYISIPMGTRPEEDFEKMFDTYIGRGGMYRYFTTGEVDYGGKLLLSYTTRTDIPVEIVGNVGYFTHHKDINANRISYGLGIGVLYRHFTPYIEITGWEREAPEPTRVLYLTPGVKIGDKTATSINIALNFRIVPGEDPDDIVPGEDTGGFISAGKRTTPSWSFNISYVHGFTFFMPPLPAPVISGIVVDKKTREPLSAIISLPDTVIEADATGKYLIEVEPGSFIMRAEKDGYRSGDRSVVIKPGQEILVTFDLEKIRIREAEITGKVMDRVTERPIAAEITFPDTDIEPTVTDETGVFKLDLSPGTYIIKITADGYLPHATPLSVKDGETLHKDFYLLIEKVDIQMAEIAGKVMDRVTGTPIAAEVSIPDTDIEPYVADETGVFKLEISPGTHVIRITADGYIPYATPVSVKEGETLLKDFYVLRRHETITLKGIHFATGRAEIEPTYYPILDEGLKLLREFPNIRVEIRGHTDNVGSADMNLRLSQARAESIKTYLIGRGIAPARLDAVGYGEAMPVADNATERGRALNRRIEFYILGE